MERPSSTWISDLDGATGMMWLASKKCPECKGRNVKWWDLVGLAKAFRCNDCKTVGVDDGSQ